MPVQSGENFSNSTGFTDADVGLLAAAADNAADVLDGALSRLREDTHLFRNDRKARALLARARRLNGRVEGEQMRAGAYILDGGDELVDLRGGNIDPVCRDACALGRERRVG